jgi:hypothetical protein
MARASTTCLELARLERELSCSGSLGPCIESYERHLQEARRASGPKHAGSSFMRCRVQTLGENLRDMLPRYNRSINERLMRQTVSPMYAAWNRDLARHELKDYDAFESYHTRGFYPRVFHWPEHCCEELFLKLLTQDSLYNSTWKRAVENLDVGPPTVSIQRIGSHTFRHVRAQQTSHFLVLYHSTGRLPSSFDQVVEFGGGTGDMPSVLQDLDFRGAALVYDLPWMLLLHQFWHRYAAAVPAYLIADEADVALSSLGPGANPATSAPLAGRVALVSSLHGVPLTWRRPNHYTPRTHAALSAECPHGGRSAFASYRVERHWRHQGQLTFCGYVVVR